MTGSLTRAGDVIKVSKKEARAIRRVCPQEAIRRASARPDGGSAAAAASATAASMLQRDMAAVALEQSQAARLQDNSDDDQDDVDEMPLCMNRVSRKEQRAVRRACPREGLRRASIRPDAMAHMAVIQAAIQAEFGGRESAPATMKGSGVPQEAMRPQLPSRPSSADAAFFSPRTQKAVRRVMPKKSMRFHERSMQKHESVDEHEDLMDLATLGRAHDYAGEMKTDSIPPSPLAALPA